MGNPVNSDIVYPEVLYLVIDLLGNSHVFYNLKDCPVHFDTQGILVAAYRLEDVGTLTQKIHFDVGDKS